MSGRRTLRVGLTGSIAMGKSETARIFRRLGVPVFDADEAVHALYARDGAAVEPIRKAFPDAVVDGAVDREALSKAILGNPAAIERLEAIVHPLVSQMQQDFLAAAEGDGEPMVVLDIPLLFETGGESRVDRIVVVSAPAEIQRARALARPGMTDEKLELILSRQLPDAQKRRRADFVVDTSRSLEDAFEQVARIVDHLRAEAPGSTVGRQRGSPSQ